jgi:hypothetical protein
MKMECEECELCCEDGVSGWSMMWIVRMECEDGT